MLTNIAIAIAIILITVAIHAGGMVLILHKLENYDMKHRKHKKYPAWQVHINWVTGAILVMFFASLLEVMVWAATFIALNAIQGYEQALYFSVVTYTTLGYGDVLLDENWRLLGSFAAVNGIIMFGWTTAIVIAVVQRVYFGDKVKNS